MRQEPVPAASAVSYLSSRSAFAVAAVKAPGSVSVVFAGVPAGITLLALAFASIALCHGDADALPVTPPPVPA
jgi:hypothetical protein